MACPRCACVPYQVERLVNLEQLINKELATALSSWPEFAANIPHITKTLRAANASWQTFSLWEAYLHVMTGAPSPRQ